MRKTYIPGFAKRLDDAILANAKPIGEIERACGFPHGRIWKYTHCGVTPSAEALYTMCKALNVSADRLLGLKE